ncbi:MAG: glycoside hydrolase family 25 [Oscillospiraceae bacterium]|nr:glycoside hydrolase family 25 [Oscillospiraceae bacterium]
MKFKYILAVILPAFLFTGSTDRSAERSQPIPQTETVPAVSETTSAVTSTTATTTATAAATTSVMTTTVTTSKKTEPPADLILKCMDTVEAGTDISLENFITERNVELKDGSAWLNTSDIGTFQVEVPYIYKGEEFSQTLQYRVADTTKPYIFNQGKNSKHKLGKEFDLNNYVGFGDNYDKHPVLTYEGEVDPNTAGSYPLTAKVTDSAGNSVSWELTVHVVEEIPKSPDTIPRVNYSDFISRYQSDDVRFGIDVSAWQADIDYDAVRDAGCSFVMIRIGHFYSKIKLDDYFHQNLKNAAAAGLDAGIYFYTTDRTEDGVREHVRWIVDQLNGQKLDLPIAFDWEEFSNFQKYGMSIRDLNDVYAAFADEVRKHGYQPMLYGSKNVMETIWSEKSKQIAPVWLAHYTKKTSYEGEYAIWQASAYGLIPGIEGDVDMDIQYLTQKIN